MPADNENNQEKQGRKKLPKQMPWVIPTNCEGCGDCVNHCRNGYLQMTETNVKGVYVPWLSKPEKCSGCGRCAEVCVMGAIAMTSYVEDAMRRFREQKPLIPT